MTKLSVQEIVGPICITLEDGGAIYKKLRPEVMQKHQIDVDFDGVMILASPFLNAAIGQLLKEISSAELHQLLTFSNLSDADRIVLDQVIENAEMYYHADQDEQAALDAILFDEEI
jgi:hypothetical protein